MASARASGGVVVDDEHPGHVGADRGSVDGHRQPAAGGGRRAQRCRPSPRRTRERSPGRARRRSPPRSSRRWNGANIRSRSAGRRPARGRRRRSCTRRRRSRRRRRPPAPPAGSCRQRVVDEVRDDPLEQAGSASTSGRSSGTSTSTPLEVPAGRPARGRRPRPAARLGWRTTSAPGLQPAQVEQVGDQVGQPVGRRPRSSPAARRGARPAAARRRAAAARSPRP